MPKTSLWPHLPVAKVRAVYNAGGPLFEAGAYDYIPRPINFDYLKTALLVKLF